MVKKLLDYLHREIGGLHQAAYLLGVFAFLSQILALVRDRLLAYSFGAGPELDLYYASFRIPDIIFAMVASVVSISVLIPVFVERMSKGSEAGKKFLDTILTFFFVSMIGVSTVAFVAVPKMIPAVFPGFAEPDRLVGLTRILLLSPIILGLSNLLGSVTQTHKRFFVYASSPILYNIGIIAGILFLEPRFGITGVAIGVVLGALLHLGIQIPSVVKLGSMPKLTLRPDMKEIRTVMGLSLPRTIALSVSQLALLFLVSMASFMPIGSIAVFNLSFNLQSVPLSIIGVSYSLAAFPTLAKLYSSGERKMFVGQILASARHIVFWALPATSLFIVLRAHIVRVILGSGEFDWADTRLTAAALGLFMISAVFQSLVLLIVRGYYSAGKTRTPLIINILSGMSILVFSFVLTKLFAANNTFRFFVEALFRVEEIGGTEVLMLPLGYTLGMIGNGLVLWAFFSRSFDGFGWPLFRSFFHSFSASVVAGFVAYIVLSPFSLVFDNETFIGVFLQGFSAGIVGIVAGILLLKLLGSRELEEIRKALHKKFWKAKPLGPDPGMTT